MHAVSRACHYAVFRRRYDVADADCLMPRWLLICHATLRYAATMLLPCRRRCYKDMLMPPAILMRARRNVRRQKERAMRRVRAFYARLLCHVYERAIIRKIHAAYYFALPPS